MEHPSLEKIIRFISFDELNEENLSLASEINLHMIECADCRKKIQSIQNTLQSLLTYSQVKNLDVSDMSIDDDIQSELNDFYSE